jgi:hypothetical protein
MFTMLASSCSATFAPPSIALSSSYLLDAASPQRTDDVFILGHLTRQGPLNTPILRVVQQYGLRFVAVEEAKSRHTAQLANEPKVRFLRYAMSLRTDGP